MNDDQRVVPCGGEKTHIREVTEAGEPARDARAIQHVLDDVVCQPCHPRVQVLAVRLATKTGVDPIAREQGIPSDVDAMSLRSPNGDGGLGTELDDLFSMGPEQE